MRYIVLLNGPRLAFYGVDAQPVASEIMTSLPLVLDDEPLGIVLSTGPRTLRPARIWAYCWCDDDLESGDHVHRRLPVDPHPVVA